MINEDYEVFNPHDKPVEALPVIYGFNNGGARGWLSGQLIAEDGAGLGGHVCSCEGFMYGDLGITKGSRPDRHAGFKSYYPDGYRMDFVPASDIADHKALNLVFELNKKLSIEKVDTEQVGESGQ